MTITTAPLVETTQRGDIAWITLARSHRANALVPDLLDAVSAALDTATSSGARAVVLTGKGQVFSAGGDVREFRERIGRPAELHAYSARLVGLLNEVILKLHTLPVPTVCGLNGALTGGSLGLALACDVRVLHEQAWVQPYYAQMGFAPDGGWTALLPAFMAAADARSWIARDEKRNAGRLARMGLGEGPVSDAHFHDRVQDEAERLAHHDPATLITARRLLGPPDLAHRLEAEREAFLDLVQRSDTHQRMISFVDG